MIEFADVMNKMIHDEKILLNQNFKIFYESLKDLKKKNITELVCPMCRK